MWRQLCHVCAHLFKPNQNLLCMCLYFRQHAGPILYQTCVSWSVCEVLQCFSDFSLSVYKLMSWDRTVTEGSALGLERKTLISLLIYILKCTFFTDGRTTVTAKIKPFHHPTSNTYAVVSLMINMAKTLIFFIRRDCF